MAAFEKLIGYQITSLQTLRESQHEYAFVGFDVEFLREERAATEVGLALLPDLSLALECDENGWRTLQSFVKLTSVTAVSIKISGRHQFRARQLARMRHEPRCEPSAFGKDLYADLGGLESAMRAVIGVFRSQVGSKRLILTGFSLSDDFEAMKRDFPGIAGEFEAYVDVSQLQDTLADRYPPRRSPGVAICTRLFQIYPFSAWDNPNTSSQPFRKHCMHIVVHNAANDAVRTLALHHALPNLSTTMLDRLRQKQSDQRGLDMYRMFGGATRVMAGQLPCDHCKVAYPPDYPILERRYKTVSPTVRDYDPYEVGGYGHGDQ
ncbi:hypothetical protein F5Y18DRAFT_78138 [Xylariaceae sp. FL1019]|nr:hypothetical protein F5Y18DRAFT_78138 [Xylariaceae sp. FL1019]